MGAVTYPNPKVVEFIEQNLIPIQVAFDAKPLSTDFTGILPEALAEME